MIHQHPTGIVNTLLNIPHSRTGSVRTPTVLAQKSNQTQGYRLSTFVLKEALAFPVTYTFPDGLLPFAQKRYTFRHIPQITNTMPLHLQSDLYLKFLFFN